MVWLEKPAANSVIELKKLESLRRLMKQPSTVLVNFHRRYNENYQKMKHLIHNFTGIHTEEIIIEQEAI